MRIAWLTDIHLDFLSDEAFERARAANTPSLPERDLFACPN